VGPAVSISEKWEVSFKGPAVSISESRDSRRIGNPVSQCIVALKSSKPRRRGKTAVTGITVIWARSLARRASA
jgi:hypothetical protein